MVIPEKVRAMDTKQKFHYYFERLLNEQLGQNQKQEAMDEISKLMTGTPIDKIGETFGVDCIYDLKATPATLTISIPGTDHKLEVAIAAQDRDQFEDAQPEAQKRPIKSMLTEEEQKELLEQINDVPVNR